VIQKVYEPQIRARLGNHNTMILGFCRNSLLTLEPFDLSNRDAPVLPRQSPTPFQARLGHAGGRRCVQHHLSSVPNTLFQCVQHAFPVCPTRFFSVSNTDFPGSTGTRWWSTRGAYLSREQSYQGPKWLQFPAESEGKAPIPVQKYVFGRETPNQLIHLA